MFYDVDDVICILLRYAYISYFLHTVKFNSIANPHLDYFFHAYLCGIIMIRSILLNLSHQYQTIDKCETTNISAAYKPPVEDAEYEQKVKALSQMLTVSFV